MSRLSFASTVTILRGTLVLLAAAWLCPGASASETLPATDPRSIEATTVATFPPYVPTQSVSGVIRIQGHGHVTLKWMERLLTLWEKGFQRFHPGVRLQQDMKGTSSAIPSLFTGAGDIAILGEELDPAAADAFARVKGYQPTVIEIATGSLDVRNFDYAQQFFVHKDNPIEQITFQQLDAMYSTTHARGGKAITKWGDLGLTGEWADKPIKLYGIKPWNGFEEFVRQRVLSTAGKRGEWREDIRFEKVVFPMAKDIAADRYGIGYSGMAYTDAPVKLVALVEKEGDEPQAPSYENVALATYPLSRLVFFNTNKAPGKPLNPVLEEFLRFVLSREGQQVVLDHARYLPLRASQAASARALLGS